ncbi:prepilin peptidase [Lactiplantibacillus daowaiensis]|uniref:Prepilin peptidase n=1 Tax=Lactiplantibacillus daowaiensis TaxID=2559918 RepID=A0ABW1RYV4_9LACO|nr:A24 family peptidase [Lactiplantibacillus daowaiensis]
MYATLLFFIGMILGSFLTCMAERLSAGQSIFNTSRSHCPVCQHPLRVWQLMPLIGISCQRGRCFDCHTPISWRSTFIELTTGSLLLITLTDITSLKLVLYFGYLVLIFNSLTDYLTFNVYPLTLVPPALLGWWVHPLTFTGDTWLVVGLLVALYAVAILTTKFGLGDVDVLVMLTLLASPAVVLSSLTLAACGALLILCLQRSRTHLPFVPFMTWAFILTTQLT